MSTAEQDFATGWKPSPGDTMTGKVVDLAIGQGGYDPYPIVTLEQEGGTQVALHCFHDVLKNELARRRPAMGDELTVTYKGKAAKGYHVYSVKSDRDPDFSWGQFGGDVGSDIKADEIDGIGPSQTPNREQPADDDIPL